MNKVLIIAYYFPPMGMGGVQRTLKFAKYLKEFGWQPVVITSSPKKYFAVDEYLLNEAIESGVIIERTGKGDFDVKKIITKTPNEFYVKLRSKLSQIFLVPDNKILWRKKAFKKINEIWKKYDGFDLVFSTAPPFTDFLIGLDVKEKYTVPLIIDYRDDWIDNQIGVKPPTFMHRSSNVSAEKKVLKKANKVITINRRIKELIISRNSNLQYNEVVIIPQGFDNEDFEKARKSELPKTEKMRFTYSGNFYNYKNKVYFESIKLFFESYPHLLKEVEFCFIGSFPKEFHKLVAKLNIADKINIVGYVDHIDCVKYLESSDVLFLMRINSRDREFSAMGGSKVGEYIGSRKNIIANIPESHTKRELTKYEAIKFVEEESPAHIVRAMYEYYQLWKEDKMPKANEAMVQQYDRRKLTYDLSVEFNQFIEID
ncbi:hypothetical protein BH10BAC5_BH10BAC5_06150 [soil metagenome]